MLFDQKISSADPLHRYKMRVEILRKLKRFQRVVNRDSFLFLIHETVYAKMPHESRAAREQSVQITIQVVSCESTSVSLLSKNATSAS